MQQLDISEKILLLRRRRGLSNADLAAITGLCKSSISRMQAPGQAAQGVDEIDVVLTALGAYVVIGKEGPIYRDDILNVIRQVQRGSGLGLKAWSERIGESYSNIIRWAAGVYPVLAGARRLVDEMGIRLQLGEGQEDWT